MSVSTKTTGTNTAPKKTLRQWTASLFTFKGILFMILLSISLRHILPKINKYLRLHSLDTIALNAPTYAIYAGPQSIPQLSNDEKWLHVINTLERTGYRRVEFEDDWDLLWAQKYPFLDKYKKRFQNLDCGQKINHFPGTGYLTSKVDLCTSGSKYLPKAFRLPWEKDDFLIYHKNNPNASFVEKSNNHRNILIKSAKQINLSSEKTFIQEFIDDPYLVDGYKFDIGVYVVITNLNPLRVYIYTGDYNFRFCPEKYYPFDPKNVNKYVVADNYLAMWEIPSLRIYYETFKFNYKDSFDAHVRKQKQDPEIIWNQIEEIIRHTILAQEHLLLDASTEYNNENFFEMMRFDLIVNKNLKVYLMEANMSPNLSSVRAKHSSVYFEQILYNIMELVGISSSIKRRDFETHTFESIISTEKSIAVGANTCLENHCEQDCDSIACNLCLNCMTTRDLEMLYETYREHIHRAETKRIFPKPITNLSEFNIDEELKGLIPSNQMITKWFYEKCKVDSTWCT